MIAGEVASAEPSVDCHPHHLLTESLLMHRTMCPIDLCRTDVMGMALLKEEVLTPCT